VRRLALVLMAFACAKPEPTLSVASAPTGIDVHGAGSAEFIEVQDASGHIIARQTPATGLNRTWIPLDWSAHKSVSIDAHLEDVIQRFTLSSLNTADTIRLAIPLGQSEQAIERDGNVVYPAIGDSSTEAGVSLTAMDDAPIHIHLGATSHTVMSPIPGQRIAITGPIRDRSTLEIQLGTDTIRTTLSATPIGLDDARKRVHIKGLQFPTDSLGERDLARPRQRITLPSLWWSRMLNVAGIGIRPHDRTVPWGHVSVDLHNGSDVSLNLSTRIRVMRGDSPDPSFVPTMRDVDDGTGWVSAQVRIGAHEEARLTLPLYIDEDSLNEENRDRISRQLYVEVSPIGSPSTIAQRSAPIHIQRGSSVAAAGMLLGLLGSFAGLIMISLRLKRWLGLPTTTLVTIALFSTLSFVVNAATQLLGMGVASVLGPFAFLLTGLVDETIRGCLLATLLFLRPRPGVCALAVMVGWLMRSVILGMGGPADLLYLTGHIFFLEGSLWLCGLTRGHPMTFLRIGMALSICFTVSILAALSFNVVLYRLFYAEWYVLLNVVMSGVVFPFIAAWLAVPFARSLQRVED
jgi:hypothetical protein